MYERILLPIDGSEAAANAIAHALDLTEAYDGSLHTVSVVDTSDAETEDEHEAMYDEFEEESKAMVEEVIRRAEERGVRTVSGSIATGRPHRAILQYAEDNDIDLIVMGTHERRGILHALRRSVTEKVLRRATVPVLSVRLQKDSSE